ncbi:MAG: MFS transporter [Clostridia bacterium]|nr:MFS transporter [Clostridia bacterium]
MKKTKLDFKTKLFYGFGNLGYGSMGQTVSSFIMFFGTSVLGLPGFLVGTIIAVTSLWDGLSDPVIGYLSDRTKSKFFGRRLGHMLFASFALALNNIFLWLCPQSGSTFVMALWLIGFLLLQETFNTFFATPYSALCIDIAPDYNDQTKMQGFKTVFYIMGLILPSVLMYVFMPSSNFGVQAQFDRQGYINIAYVNSALALVCGLTTVFGTRIRVRSMPNYSEAMVEELQDNDEKSADVVELREGEAKLKKHKRKKQGGLAKIMAGYVETFKKKDFRTVMLGYSVSLIASVFITSVGMHLFTFCYHFSSIQISTLMICLFGGAIVSQLLWVNIVKKYDKKQTLIFALCVMLFGIAMTSITFLFRLYTTSNVIFWYVLPCLFICGVGSGALYSLPHSMYADVVTMEAFKTGKNNAGRYTGYYTFTYNFSNSIALLFIGLLLDLVKFDSSQPVQALSVQTGLGKIVFFGSAIAITCAIIIFSKYSIKRADVLKIQIQANEKKAGEAKGEATGSGAAKGEVKT